MKRKERIEVRCKKCNKILYRLKSEIRGEIFCNNSCANSYNNNRTNTGKLNIHNYRQRALEFYGSFCHVCGYGIEEVLEVHHIDCNRRNNKIKNLVVLCPTHHVEVQIGLRILIIILKG